MDSNFINIELEKIDDQIEFEVFSDEHFGDPKRDIVLCNKRLKFILRDKSKRKRNPVCDISTVRPL